MNAAPPFACRPLDPHDLSEARALTEEVGVHAAYVRNAIEGDDVHPDDQIYALHGAERMLGVVYFGRRGNLIVVEREPVDADRLAEAIRELPWEWRIVLGRHAVVAALRRSESRIPLVYREQVYYSVEGSGLRRDLVVDDVRLATRKDAKWLMAAALDLNESDLNVQRWRVNRAWLRATVRRRISQQETWLLGPEGQPTCKLDVGSRGATATIIEGVYTDPEHRGQGAAARLVATASAAFLTECPVVCLHVAADNLPARRAYERAGMSAVANVWLMLRG